MEGVTLNNSLKWLYLDLNSYFASVEQQLRPETRGKPLIVVPTESDTTSAIAASYEAKRLGIKTNTNVGEAKKICPELIVVLANHENYVSFHHKIIAEIDKYIPIDTVASIDEFACLLQGKECTPEGAKELSDRIKKGLRENVGVAITCSVGIAPNKYLAKIASDMQKPDGFTIIGPEPEDITAKLLTLKPRDLPGIGWNMEGRLGNSGIGTVQQILALDPKHMRKLWHSLWGEKLWYLLRGYEIPDMETKRSTVGHSHVLAPQLRSQPKAYIVAQRLMLKAASRLRRMSYYTKAMGLSIRTQGKGARWGERVFVQRTFYRTCDSFSMQHVLEDLWKDAIKQIGKYDKIKKVSVTLHDLVAAGDIQPELLDMLEDSENNKQKKYEKISHVMDNLNAKFGRDTIVLGFSPDEINNFSGTKVAFTRIPDKEEFHE